MIPEFLEKFHLNCILHHYICYQQNPISDKPVADPYQTEYLPENSPCILMTFLISLLTNRISFLGMSKPSSAFILQRFTILYTFEVNKMVVGCHDVFNILHHKSSHGKDLVYC